MSQFGSVPRRVHALGFALGLMLVSTVRGDDYSWNAPGGGNWNEPAKWDRIGGGTGIPTGADNATIEVAGTYTVNLTDPRAITTLTVNRSTATLNHTSGILTGNGAFQLAAGTYTLNGATLTQNGAMSTSVGSALNFTTGTWNGTGSATVGGAFNWNAGSLTGSGTVTATGPISLGGSGSNIRTLNGTKTLVLDADATWSAGQIWIDNGTTFRINPGRVLTTTGSTVLWWNSSHNGTYDIRGTFRKTDSSTTTFNSLVNYDVSGAVEVLGGTLSITDNASLVGFASNTLGKGTWRVQGGTLVFSGAGGVQTIGPNATVILDGATSTFNALNALTQNNGTLRILGGKTFTPTAASVSVAGTLEVGAGSTFGKGVVVQSGGTLVGAGVVGGPLVAESGGTVVPGTGPSELTVNSNLTLQSGSALVVELNGTTPGTQYDRLAVNGTVDLTGATLTRTLGYLPSAGDLLFIVTNDGTDAITGRFAGLPDGAIVTYPDGTTARISYFGDLSNMSSIGGNDVVLHAFQPVPEPGSVLALAGLTLALIGWCKRSRRKGSSPE